MTSRKRRQKVREAQLCQICLHQCHSGQSFTGWKSISISIAKGGGNLPTKAQRMSTIPSQTAFVSKAQIKYLDRGRMAHETLKAAANKKHQDIYSVFLRVRSLMAMSTASCSTRNRESPSQSQMQIGMFPCRRALSTDQMVVLASRQLECLHPPVWASHKCR